MRTKAACGEQVSPGHQSMLKVPDSWLIAWPTGKVSEGGWRDAKWPWPGKESVLPRHPPLHPCCTGRNSHLLTATRDEDLHRAAERSHSPFGDGSHTDRAGGIGGHHGQDGHAGVRLGFSGDVLLERGREEKPGLGETAAHPYSRRETQRFIENCLLKLLCCFAFTSPEEMQHQTIYGE